MTVTPGGEAPSRAFRTVKLGRGQVVPYPEPGSDAATRVGLGNRRTDTKPEVSIRSAVHRRGLRFRKDHVLRVGGVRVRADLAFTGAKAAVFVDGCFWHRCPEHGSTPKRNLEYWIPKLQANTDRDARVNAALEREGWTVIRVWEHEHVDAAADRITSAVKARRAEAGGSAH